jgi:CRP-like cAMP-binding protein
MGSDVEAFRQAYLVAGLSDDEVRRLSELAVCRDLAPGEVLVHQGEDNSDLFVILSGSAAVTRNGTFIRTRGPGAVIGEIALIDDLPRSATVTASEPLTACHFDSPELRAFLFRNKHIGFVVLGNLARVLFERLDEAAGLQPEADSLGTDSAPDDRKAQIIDSLKHFYRISGLFDDEVQMMSEMARLKELEDGEIVVKAGDEDRHLFVILEGSAAISTKDGAILGERRKGAVIGELALIDCRPRATTVTARGEVLLARFDGPRLRSFVARNPEIGYVLVSNLARLLSARLREASTS